MSELNNLELLDGEKVINMSPMGQSKLILLTNLGNLYELGNKNSYFELKLIRAKLARSENGNL